MVPASPFIDGKLPKEVYREQNLPGLACGARVTATAVRSSTPAGQPWVSSQREEQLRQTLLGAHVKIW